MGRRSGGREASQVDALITALYYQHGQAVLAYATRLTGDRSAGEDVTQETILRAWRHPDVLVNGKDYVRGWLLKVARNIVIDRVRAQKARPQEVAEDPTRPPVARDHAQGVVDLLAVLDGLDQLTDNHRAVLEQVYLRDRSVRDAADALRVPEGTIKTRTAHALVALRKVMTGPDSRAEGGSA